MLNKPKEFYDIDHLDRYYKHCVIGGVGAFIAPVFDLRHLAATIRKKLVMEIASIEIEPDMAPIQFAEAPDAPATARPGFTARSSDCRPRRLTAPSANRSGAAAAAMAGRVASATSS